MISNCDPKAYVDNGAVFTCRGRFRCLQCGGIRQWTDEGGAPRVTKDTVCGEWPATWPTNQPLFYPFKGKT